MKDLKNGLLNVHYLHLRRIKINNITIVGQLGKDSELQHLSNGDPVCSFSVADQQGKDKPTIWWNCLLFGKRAESLQQYLYKGQKVTVCGTVSERDWTDKSGAARKTMNIRVTDIALQGEKQQTATDFKPASKPKKDAEFNDADIPF